MAVIAELERLVPLLKEAVQEETETALAEALASKGGTLNVDQTPQEDSEVSGSTPGLNGVAHAEDGAASSSEAVGDAVERLVQIVYFAQVSGSGLPSRQEGLSG